MSDRRETKLQRQDSLEAQMRDVHRLAEQMGCYDAADWIEERFDLFKYHQLFRRESVASSEHPGGLAPSTASARAEQENELSDIELRGREPGDLE